MNDLTIFNSSEFGEIRTVTIDGKPYFVAVDVAAALGYATPRDAISRHCKGVVKRDTPTSSGIQQILVKSADDWKMRKALQERAARNCNNLLALIQLAKTIFHLKSKRVKYWSEKTIDVRGYLRSWRDADSKRYGK